MNTKDSRWDSDARLMKRCRASSSDTADVSLLLFFLIHVVLCWSDKSVNISIWLQHFHSINLSLKCHCLLIVTYLSDLRPPLWTAPIRRWTRVCFMCCMERPCACPPSTTCCTLLLGRHMKKTHSRGCCSCRWDPPQTNTQQVHSSGL